MLLLKASDLCFPYILHPWEIWYSFNRARAWYDCWYLRIISFLFGPLDNCVTRILTRIRDRSCRALYMTEADHFNDNGLISVP
jgi:hypothetical protein